MIAKKEIREEREDIFSIWEAKKEIQTIDGVETIVTVETKIEEFTIADKEKSIADAEAEAIEKADKLLIEKAKLDLVKSL